MRRLTLLFLLILIFGTLNAQEIKIMNALVANS